MNREEFELLLEAAFEVGYEDAEKEIASYTEDAHKRILGRHLGYSPGMKPGSTKALKEKNHSERKFTKFLKKDNKNRIERDDNGKIVYNKSKLDTPKKVEEYKKARKFLLDKFKKYNDKTSGDINISKYIRKTKDSSNIKARINANYFNNIYDRGLLKEKRGEGHREIPREDD